MDRSTKSDDTIKNKNQSEKGRDQKPLKFAATKTNPKSEENDDIRSVFSDLTFTVAAAPTSYQTYLKSDATGTEIPEEPTIKGIFAAAGDGMQVPAGAAPHSMDKITVEIHKSQVTMLAKKGATIVNQGDNSYSVNFIMFSNLASNQGRNSGVYKNNVNGEVNPPYLLNAPIFGNNEADHNPETCPSSVFQPTHVTRGAQWRC